MGFSSVIVELGRVLLVGFFYNWDSLYARLNSHCKAFSTRKKKAQKNQSTQDTRDLLRKNLESIGVR